MLAVERVCFSELREGVGEAVAVVGGIGCGCVGGGWCNGVEEGSGWE